MAECRAPNTNLILSVPRLILSVPRRILTVQAECRAVESALEADVTAIPRANRKCGAVSPKRSLLILSVALSTPQLTRAAGGRQGEAGGGGGAEGGPRPGDGGSGAARERKKRQCPFLYVWWRCAHLRCGHATS